MDLERSNEFDGREVVVKACGPSLRPVFSHEHATLHSTLSVGWSVGWLVGRSVGWLVASRFGSKALVLQPAGKRETLAKEEQETD